MKIMTEKMTKPNTVIHCTTEEQSRHLLDWARSEGFKWMYREPINPDFTQWCDWIDQTCYRLHFVNKEIRYADCSYYRRNEYYILEFEEIFISDEKSSSLESETLEDCVIGLIRRTHKELNFKQELLSMKEAAHEIVKLVSQQMKGNTKDEI